MKEKIKRKSFWLGVAGAVVLALQFFGIKIDAPYVNEAIGAGCALFVFLGLIKDDTSSEDERMRSIEDNSPTSVSGQDGSDDAENESAKNCADGQERK